MSEQLIVQAIEFNSYIGVTDEERKRSQPIRVDLELTYPQGIFFKASETDDLSQAIDYSKAVEHIVELGTQKEYRLLERLAEQIVNKLFEVFPILVATVWVKKLKPPLEDVRDSVGVRLSRLREDLILSPKPAGFLVRSVPLLSKGAALDIAAGSGRNSLYLAGLGFSVDAVDADNQRLHELDEMAKQRNLQSVTTRVVDLENEAAPLAQAKERYDVVLVFFYLHRPLFPALLQAVKPGGFLVYETFLIENHLRYQHPRRKEFCLMPNELLHLTSGLRILRYEEGLSDDSLDRAHAYTARIIAQREPTS